MSTLVFRTELTEYVMDLLDFVEERIMEAKNDSASRNSALAEAMGAIPIIKNRLYLEDQVSLTKLLLIGFFDEDLTRLGALPEEEFAVKINSFCQRHLVVKAVLDGRAASPSA